MVQTLGTYIHDVNKKQLVEAIKSIKMDMEYDSQKSAELLNAVFRFPDAVHKIIVSSATIQPHWMFALDSLLRTAVQAAVTILEPDVGANLEGSMGTGTPASGSGAVGTAYIGRGNGAAVAIALQARASERRSNLSPTGEADDDTVAPADISSDPVITSTTSGDPSTSTIQSPSPFGIGMSISGRLEDAPSPDTFSDTLESSLDQSQPLQQQQQQLQLHQQLLATLPTHQVLSSTMPISATGTTRERSGSFNSRRRTAPASCALAAMGDSPNAAAQHTCASCLPPAHVQSPLASGPAGVSREVPTSSPVAPPLYQKQPSVSVSSTATATSAAAAPAGAPAAALPVPEEHSTSGVSTLDSNLSGTHFSSC